MGNPWLQMSTRRSGCANHFDRVRTIGSVVGSPPPFELHLLQRDIILEGGWGNCASEYIPSLADLGATILPVLASTILKTYARRVPGEERSEQGPR